MIVLLYVINLDVISDYNVFLSNFLPFVSWGLDLYDVLGIFGASYSITPS